MTTANELNWAFDGTSRIPFGVYTSDELHRVELERFFYRTHWCYVGLEAEVQNPGDFTRTVIGERSVIMVRDQAGDINVIENVCAHRGMRFCRVRHGTTTGFVCPYHQWRYNLQGDLRGVPFRAGVKSGEDVHGGMPEDFAPSDHGLTKLNVPGSEDNVVGPTAHTDAPSQSERLWGSAGLRPLSQLGPSLATPLLVYRWAATDAALDAQLELEAEGCPATVSPGHAAIRYTNPTNGGDVLPTIRAEFHRLASGASTLPGREVGSSVKCSKGRAR